MTKWTADDGTVIRYETFGNRSAPETLLLLPGMLGSMKTDWRNFIQALSEDFWIVTMDLRGHGRSENKAANLRPERMLQDVVGLVDALEVEALHVAGYSLGGYLGLMFALSQPRRVKTLLMHAMKFYWTKEAAVKMRAQLDPDQMAEKVPTYADQLVQAHGARHWRILVRQAADLVVYLVDNGLTERMIGNLQCPAIVSIGDRDELVPLPEALRLSRMLPKGALMVLPNVRHPFNSIRTIPFLPAIQHFHRTAHRR